MKRTTILFAIFAIFTLGCSGSSLSYVNDDAAVRNAVSGNPMINRSNSDVSVSDSGQVCGQGFTPCGGNLSGKWEVHYACLAGNEEVALGQMSFGEDGSFSSSLTASDAITAIIADSGTYEVHGTSFTIISANRQNEELDFCVHENILEIGGYIYAGDIALAWSCSSGRAD